MSCDKFSGNDNDAVLLAYINILSKRSTMIIAITMVSVLTCGILSYYVLLSVYEARAVILVTVLADRQQAVEQRDDLNSIINNVSRIPALSMNTYLGQVKSEALMQRVIEKLKLAEQGYTPGILSDCIKATAVKDSNLIEVTVSGRDPVLAASIANTLSSEFVSMTIEKNQELIDRSVNSMKEQMVVIRGEFERATNPAEKKLQQDMLTLLSDKITKTELARSIDAGGSNLVVVSPAMSPTSPVKPKKELNIAVSFVLGLAASVILSFILEFTDNTVKTPEDIARLGLPVLGIIPR